MKKEEINTIKVAFDDIYKQMEKIALNKYSNHKILIMKVLKDYISALKYDIGDDVYCGDCEHD